MKSRKNRAIAILSAIIVVAFVAYFIFHNSVTIIEAETPPIVPNKEQPLYLSIYLDLSDRIKPDGSSTLSQQEKDIAIVEYLANFIKDRAVKQHILPCKDKIKVFFYPAPSNARVALLAEQLELDLSTTPVKEKKAKLIKFVNEFKTSMEQIYTSTIKTSNWQGSDIWGFFNKPIDNYCIKDRYRNVLVILTDGYIYHAQNKQSQGSAHTFILPQTLKDTQSSLIIKRSEPLKDLEVLMLELNPNPPTDQAKMEQVITDWLKGMGIKKCNVFETDIPSNTKMIIDNFLN